MPANQSLQYIRKPNQKAVVKHELVMQRALTTELNRLNVDFYCDWASGAWLTHGQNTERLKLASRGGWVDVFVAEPHRGYHGAFFELKRSGTRVYKRNGQLATDPQIQKEAAFLERMANKGYYTTFAVGFDEALQLMYHYLEMPESQTLF